MIVDRSIAAARRLRALVALGVLVALGASPAVAADVPSELQREFDSALVSAERLLSTMERQPTAGLGSAVVLAKTATREQARVLGVGWAAGQPGPSHQSPSRALGVLLDRYGIAPTPAQRMQLRALDVLPAALRTALTRVVDAFAAMDATTRHAYAQADPRRAATLRWVRESADLATAAERSSRVGPAPWRGLAWTGVDVSPILVARNALLDASLTLQRAAAATSLAAPPTVNMCPAFALDLVGSATRYPLSCALTIDVRGNDVYANNAGGAPVVLTDPLVLSPTAAAIDLSGADRYGTPARRFNSSVNGAAIWGAGFLLDAAGSDVYTGEAYGVNGGGQFGGLGLLVDGAGNDTYTASHGGVNGGGTLFGAGLLVDTGGRDVYSVRAGMGANGGGAVGAGMLISSGGHDSYVGGGDGVNGGGFLGVGALLDRDGNDRYRAALGGANGGGEGGVGLLLDQGGTDWYYDRDMSRLGGNVTRCPGSGRDRTVAPKCIVGAQLDLP